MDPDSNHWFELGDAATPAERQALEKFQALLPNDSVTYAWSNLTFIDASGRTNEVDVLLLTGQGLFIVELKGWHGTLTGDQQSWTLTSSTGSSSVRPNPYILTDSKAKRLAGLLKLKAPNTAARHALSMTGSRERSPRPRSPGLSPASSSAFVKTTPS
ncbi:hypothetical protein QFZ60_003091 [Arthrobacter sp. B2I5]|uniref:nuclease-related domain-containing protein n=1 Tax=Arthrobacter sp. B2I5 TaxID=3042266 RepID=UPI00278A7438|nr:nuclease-related domain-containing protein [Arthrobacter sp. B2I5]MDQ0826918.1 hypothetical protein [Arthrobacter sp. B2I5]